MDNDECNSDKEPDCPEEIFQEKFPSLMNCGPDTTIKEDVMEHCLEKQKVITAWNKYNKRMIEEFHAKGFKSSPGKKAMIHNDFEREVGL